MKGPRWAQPTPVSSPRAPEQPPPPPLSEAFLEPVGLAGMVSEGSRTCSVSECTRAQQTGVVDAGEAGQVIDSSKDTAHVAGPDDAAPSVECDLEQQSTGRKSWMWALPLEVRQGQKPQLPQTMKRSSTALSLEFCNGAPYSIQEEQTFPGQRSCPVLLAADGQDYRPHAGQEADSLIRQMSVGVKDVPEISRGMPAPGRPPSMEVIDWLSKQLRMEREWQEQHHATLIEGLQSILQESATAISMKRCGRDPCLPIPNKDACPATRRVTSLTPKYASVESPTRATEGIQNHDFSAGCSGSDQQLSTLNHKFSAGSFASDQLQSGEPVSRPTDLGSEKRGSGNQLANPVATKQILRHSNTDDHIHGMLVHRGLHEASVGCESIGSNSYHTLARQIWRSIRRTSRKLVVETHWWDYIMGVVILANCVNVGVEIQLNITNRDTTVTNILEHVFLFFFLVELAVRVMASEKQVFGDRWLQLDVVLVALGVFSQWIFGPLVGSGGTQQHGIVGKILRDILIVRVFRLVRLVRSLRFLNLFEPLWKLVRGIIGSSGTVLSAAILFVGATYILACIGVELIGHSAELQADEDAGPVVMRHFGSLPMLMLTLLQFATCDSIGQIYFPIVQARPYMVVYFLVVILVLPISLMNLVTAMIVDGSIQSSAHDAELERARMRRRLKTLIPALRRIFKELDADGDGYLDIDELDLSRVREAKEIMTAADSRSLHNLFSALDCDGSGKIDQAEFVDGMCYLLLSKVPIENMQILHLLRMQTVDIGEMKEVLIPSAEDSSR